MVLAQKQAYRSMEQNKEAEVNPGLPQLIYNNGEKNTNKKARLFNKWC